MTASQKINREIILRLVEYFTRPSRLKYGDDLSDEAKEFIEKAKSGIDESNIDDLLSMAGEFDEYYDERNGFRSCGILTGLPCESSRHYESDSVAKKMSDGSWVGWTYWHGGGKHGEPEAIDWLEDAYDLEVTEEEKMVVVREFKKVDPNAN